MLLEGFQELAAKQHARYGEEDEEAMADYWSRHDGLADIGGVAASLVAGVSRGVTSKRAIATA